MQFIVIESTPGYMPEDDDPFIGSFGEALAAATERAAELRDDMLKPRSIIFTALEPNEFATFHLVDTGDPHDLGRIVEVMEVIN